MRCATNSLRKLLSHLHFRRCTPSESLILSRSFTNFSNKCSSPPYSKESRRVYYPSTTVRPIFRDCRSYSVDTDREVDRINLKFAEAREEIESAMESKETVYFNEEAECAREVVREVLELYDALLKKLDESERAGIQRAMGLKIEQLKAELEQLNE